MTNRLEDTLPRLVPNPLSCIQHGYVTTERGDPLDSDRHYAATNRYGTERIVRKVTQPTLESVDDGWSGQPSRNARGGDANDIE